MGSDDNFHPISRSDEFFKKGQIWAGRITDDEIRSEVFFGYTATADSADPVYDYKKRTCSSTYYHWRKDATWTDVGGWSECGSCHALPPLEPHINWPQCYFCHYEVWGEFGIEDPTLHINGVINTCTASFCHSD